MSNNPTTPGPVPAKSPADEPTSLRAQDAKQILRLLCTGAAQEHGIRLVGCVLEHDGTVTRLELQQEERVFCARARELPCAKDLCSKWYEEAAQVWRQLPLDVESKVRECPFGLSVLVAPVGYRDQVRVVLFSGNWRESGAEGIVYHRLQQANIPEDERNDLARRVSKVGALVGEEMESHRRRLASVVGDVSRLIGLMYGQYLAVQEHALIQAMEDGLARLPRTNLAEACKASSRLLTRLCQQLDIEFAVLFANVGLLDRLEVVSHSSPLESSLEGIYLRGTSRDLLNELEQRKGLDQGGCSQWLLHHVAADRGVSPPLFMGRLARVLPIELGPLSVAVLVVGPRSATRSEHGEVMSEDDHRRLVQMAAEHLRNGLREFAEKQEMADILGTTSHILRGPLMAMQGAIGELRRFLSSGPVDAQAMLEITKDLQNQVDDIAAQAELLEEAKKISLYQRDEPRFRRAPLAALIEKVLPGFVRKAAERCITFRGLKAIHDLLLVEFDWNQMKVVFVNLLDNALKYAHGNSLIDFTGEQTTVEGIPIVRIGIVDFGTGIRSREIEREIFKPGFRGTIRDEKRHVSGTGMGLAVCRDIVENVHHGRIWARCRESGGVQSSYQHCRVEFYVELPITQD